MALPPRGEWRADGSGITLASVDGDVVVIEEAGPPPGHRARDAQADRPHYFGRAVLPPTRVMS
jgi:hypothetical protein